MEEQNKNSISEADDEILFANESSDQQQPAAYKSWKILIVDDEEIIHHATRIALGSFTFEGSPLEFVSAYSGSEAKKKLADSSDIAVVLLDVVMETNEAGLEVARYVRDDLRNKLVRIILRTGQPGAAPEKKVITNYEINDYKEKTELTEPKLFSTITTAIRSYRDLKNIEKNRKGLELIIGSTGQLFADQRLRNFTEGVLTQLHSLLNLDEGSFYVQSSGFAVSHAKDRLNILAGTGEFKEMVNKPLEEVVTTEMLNGIKEAINKQESIFTKDAYIGYFCTENGSVNLLYLDGCHDLKTVERNLIRTFSSNIAIAYDKIYLNQEILDTQREVIEVLGSVVESRSNETANHVRRVAEFTHLLALLHGMNSREAGLLKQASPMHDVGKIGIPDAILNKPGKLTPEEFDEIKQHTDIGFSILKNSKREIMQTAAIVAHQHHERWDGTGYPRGLHGESIHLYGRITAIVDVFDALFNKRTYKESMPLQKVVDIIKAESGKQFDPSIVETFLEHIDDFAAINTMYPD